MNNMFHNQIIWQLHFTIYFQSGAVVETLEKKQLTAAKFLGLILHHANLFSMLGVRAAIGIRLEGTVMQYKL